MPQSTDNKKLVFFIAAIAATGGLLFGYDTGVISGALLFIKHDFALDSVAQEFIVSSVLVGAIFGAAVSGKLTDRFGRRDIIIFTALIFSIGTFWASMAHSITQLITGRALLGVAIGAASFSVPLYISEISPPKYRGALVSLNQLMITIGIVASYVVDDIFAHLGHGWRYMFMMGIIPAAVLGVGMLFLPRSPRWLMSKKREKEARLVLDKLLATDSVTKEMDAIKSTFATDSTDSWSELASPWLRPALLIGVGIMFVQQATGINTVIYYAPTIFQMAGFKSAVAAIAATTGVGVVNVVMTVVSIKLIDKIGRKPLLSIGLIGMIISLGVLGLAFMLEKQLGASLRWVAVGSLLGYIASFAISLGPIAWLLISEVFPTNIRGLAMSLCSLANWGFNFVIALTFLSIVDVLGQTGAFWLYATIGLGGWFFCRFYVPETKGIDLETIESNLRSGKSARHLGQTT